MSQGVTKIVASADGNMILWDQVNDVFCYFDGDEVKYIPESVDPTRRKKVTGQEVYLKWATGGYQIQITSVGTEMTVTDGNKTVTPEP